MIAKEDGLADGESTSPSKDMTIGTVPPEIVKAIKFNHGKVEEAVENALRHAMACGDLLIEAKSKVAHGEWTAWAEANIVTDKFSLRTIDRWMQLARNRSAIESSTEPILTITEAIDLVKGPSNPPRMADLAGRLAELESVIHDAIDSAIESVLAAVDQECTDSGVLGRVLPEIREDYVWSAIDAADAPAQAGVILRAWHTRSCMAITGEAMVT